MADTQSERGAGVNQPVGSDAKAQLMEEVTVAGAVAGTVVDLLRASCRDYRRPAEGWNGTFQTFL